MILATAITAVISKAILDIIDCVTRLFEVPVQVSVLRKRMRHMFIAGDSLGRALEFVGSTAPLWPPRFNQFGHWQRSNPGLL